MKQKITFLKITGFCIFLSLLGSSQTTNAANVVFSSVIQTQKEVQASQAFLAGSHYQRLLRIDITTAAGTGTVNDAVTQFDFTVTGFAEISKITVVRGSNNIPDLATTFGSIDNPGAAASVIGTYTLTGATQFFALVDIKSTATAGNTIDIECNTAASSVTVGGTAKPIPAIVTNENRNAVVSATLGTQTQDEVTASQPFGLGTRYQRLLRMDIISGDITQFDFNITGSAEISKITILRSYGNKPDLTLPILGSVNNPGATVSITGSFTNYSASQLTVVVDIKPDAILGNTVDVQCTGVTVGGTIFTLTPAGTNSRNGVVSANITGIKTIKATGGDYTSIRNAFADINNKGFGGPIELVLDDDITYTHVAGEFSDYPYDRCLRQSPTATNTLIIRRSGIGTNRPIINAPGSSSAEDLFIGFLGSDYVTIDGIEFNATGTTSSNKFENGIWFKGLPNDGCCNNTIKNCVIRPNDTFSNNRIYGIYFKSYATETAGSNKNNKIFNNTITDTGDAGVCFNDQTSVTNTAFNDENNEIYNNTITGFFGVATGGIYLNNCKDTKIYNNTLDGYGKVMKGFVRGIISNYTCTGYVDCYGNTLKNFTSDGYCVGMSMLSATVHIYNNTISNLVSTSTTSTGTSAGIQLNTNNTLNPDFYLWNNTVSFNAANVTPGTGKTTALFINSNQSTVGVKLINNIFVNNSAGTNNLIVYAQNQSKSKIDAISDNNLYYPESTGFMSFNDGTYNTFALYKSGMITRDQHSVSALPAFASATDLHITSNNTPASNGGKNVVGVTTDIVGVLRNVTTPDMGAYEFGMSTAKTSITGLNYHQSQGPSAEQTLPFTGTALTGDITVTPSANLEISTGTGASFVAMNPITLTKNASGNVATPVYVRLKGGLAVGSYTTESIAITTTNEATQNIACSGDVDLGTSITKIDASTSARIYTQKGQIIADLLSVKGATEIKVIAVNGSILKTMLSNGSEILKINVPNKGLYLVRIQNGDRISTQKVVL